jgi:cellobiose dehydrogenase (acceptor)
VVDVNTKVYGTDNLFVVDASIFPGMPTGNPSAMIVIASEQASQRILNLQVPAALGSGKQCGGRTWGGSFNCQAPYVCTFVNHDYSVVSIPSPFPGMVWIENCNEMLTGRDNAVRCP